MESVYASLDYILFRPHRVKTMDSLFENSLFAKDIYNEVLACSTEWFITYLPAISGGSNMFSGSLSASPFVRLSVR